MKDDSENNYEEDEVKKTPMQILEEAMESCKFGYFNYKLMFATLMAVYSFTSVTTTSSYILSSAECDLNMSIMEKGLLNAMPFFGQVGAGVFTGIITDAFGRKVFLVWGHAGMFICSLLEGTSQTYWMLLLGKLLDGIFLSFTFSATAVMVPEFTHKGVRDRVLLVYSSFMSLSLILCALVAWGMLTQPWHLVIVPGYFELHSWNIYLYASSITSFIAMLMYMHLPESPKFLLTSGKESEALEVIKRIYHENSGNPKDSFPITSFNASGVHITPEKISIKKQLTNALTQSKELFQRPLVFQVLLFAISTFVCLFAYSSLRLWFPQISTIIENYQNKHSGDTARFCVMIDQYTSELANNVSLVAASNSISEVCVPHPAGADTYINGIILGFLSLILIGISSTLVDFFGQKPLMFVLFILCATCSTSLYWTSSSISIGLLLAGTCALMQCALSLQNNILVRVVPTTVRALALTLIIMLGRIGSLVGSVLFPVMLERGCMVPFMTLSIVTLKLHSWNIYLYASSITSFIAMLMYMHLPESPKFLLTSGKESEALEVIKRIYHENSGNPKDSFPITSFNASGVHITPEKISIKKQLTNALTQSKELFQRPLVFQVLLFAISTFVCLFAYSSLRLWFPQISTIIENYQNKHSGDTARFCVMIDQYTSELANNVSLVAASNSISEVCVPHPAGADTYINGIILGFLSLILIGISSTLVDFFGQKPLMFVLFILCATCSTSLYWTSSSISIGLLLAGTCALMQCALSLQNNILVRVVPTTVRALALTLIIMLGRIGSLVGSVLFPVMLERGCMVPFMTLSIVTLSVAGLVYFFPNPSKENSGTGDK